MAFFEVKVEGQATEVYMVEASTPEEAMKNWSDGDLLSQEIWDCGPVAAVLDFDQDDTDPLDDGYEIDPLHVVEYD